MAVGSGAEANEEHSTLEAICRLTITIAYSSLLLTAIVAAQRRRQIMFHTFIVLTALARTVLFIVHYAVPLIRTCTSASPRVRASVCTLDFVLVTFPNFTVFSAFALLLFYWLELFHTAYERPVSFIRQMRPVFHVVNGLLYLCAATIYACYASFEASMLLMETLIISIPTTLLPLAVIAYAFVSIRLAMATSCLAAARRISAQHGSEDPAAAADGSEAVASHIEQNGHESSDGVDSFAAKPRGSATSLADDAAVDPSSSHPLPYSPLLNASRRTASSAVNLSITRLYRLRLLSLVTLLCALCFSIRAYVLFWEAVVPSIHKSAIRWLFWALCEILPLSAMLAVLRQRPPTFVVQETLLIAPADDTYLSPETAPLLAPAVGTTGLA